MKTWLIEIQNTTFLLSSLQKAASSNKLQGGIHTRKINGRKIYRFQEKELLDFCIKKEKIYPICDRDFLTLAKMNVERIFLFVNIYNYSLPNAVGHFQSDTVKF